MESKLNIGIVLLLASLVAFSVTSCKKKGCTDPKADNFDPEAEKEDSSCVYTGCHDPDKNCQNGGECLDDGSCDCKEGYTGSFCEEEITPTSMTIEKIVLKGFPPDQYDSDKSGADPYIVIKDNDANLIVSTIYYTDASSSGEYTYSSKFPVTVKTPSEDHFLHLYDRDSIDDDNIPLSGANYTWSPYQQGEDFPETETIFNSNVGVEYELYYTYSFD
jgi:hypothetical protein